MEGISPEQLREMPDPVSVRRYVENGFITGWSEDHPIAAEWLLLFSGLLDALALKEAPTHPEYDVALPEIEEWVNRNGAW